MSTKIHTTPEFRAHLEQNNRVVDQLDAGNGIWQIMMVDNDTYKRSEMYVRVTREVRNLMVKYSLE